MMLRRAASWAILLTTLSGCYHASIETGLPPSGETIRQPFAASWIYGLVPPKVLETAAKCPNGVSRVETQLSFVNQLVGFITFGIYTPMTIMVTCAEKSSAELMNGEADFQVAIDATPEQIREVFSQAAEVAVKSQRPVYVQY